MTGTVPSRELIIASIMSKKLAESLDRLVLDVKFGPGAFMKTRDDAQKLAEGLQSAGTENNVATEFLLTPMAEPLGRTVGTALEVTEAVETLQGRGPADFVKLTLDLCEKVADSPRERLAGWLEDGTAWEKFTALVEAQGGDVSSLEKLSSSVHQAPVIRPFVAPGPGTLKTLDAGTLGAASVELGAGRQRAGDAIDFAVGFSGLRKCGDRVEKGEPLFLIHARSEDALAAAVEALGKGIEIEPT